MCGPDLPARFYSDRFGALAVLSSSDTQSLSGSLTFFNESNHDCQVATHMKFSPSGPLDNCRHQGLFVNIHEFGDISVPHDQSRDVSGAISLWPDDSLADAAAVAQNGPILRRLKQPLHLHVGHDEHGNKGIIGRRVTVCCAVPEDDRPARVLAEGIVGYNACP